MVPHAAGFVTASLLGAILFGCHTKSAAPPAASAQPPIKTSLTEPSVYSNPQLGIELTIPPGWVTHSNPEYVLMLIRPSSNEPSDCSISLDVPDLPAHIPGFIPIGLVKNGYLDDLKKKFPQLQVEEDPTPDIPRAQARKVRTTWKADDHTLHETAILMVHGDRVYILRANAEDAAYADTIAAFDAIIKSIRWIK